MARPSGGRRIPVLPVLYLVALSYILGVVVVRGVLASSTFPLALVVGLTVLFGLIWAAALAATIDAVGRPAATGPVAAVLRPMGLLVQAVGGVALALFLLLSAR